MDREKRKTQKEKRKLRAIAGGRTGPAPLSMHGNSEVAFFKGLMAYAQGALAGDASLDDVTVLRASMHFVASLAVTVASRVGGDGDGFGAACEALFLQEEAARRGDAG